MRCWIVAVALALTPTACLPCPATRASFEAIKTGMTQAEVEKLIGCAASETVGETQNESVRTTILKWDGNGEDESNLTLTFTDGKLAEKAQSRLQ